MSALEMKAFLARTEEEVGTKMKIKYLGFGFGFGFGAESSTICRVGVLLLYTEFDKKGRSCETGRPCGILLFRAGFGDTPILVGRRFELPS